MAAGRPNRHPVAHMRKTVMGAIVSLDGFMADDNDAVGQLFDS